MVLCAILWSMTLRIGLLTSPFQWSLYFCAWGQAYGSCHIRDKGVFEFHTNKLRGHGNGLSIGLDHKVYPNTFNGQLNIFIFV